MEACYNNGTADHTNVNLNNNVPGKNYKPAVPAKPQHLLGGRGGQSSSGSKIPPGCVTPKGWSRQPKFTFDNSGDNHGVIEEKSRSRLESKFSQKYRRVPKVVKKQQSFKKSIDAEETTESESARDDIEVKVDEKISVEDVKVPGEGGECSDVTQQSKSIMLKKDQENDADAVEQSEERKDPELSSKNSHVFPENKLNDPNLITPIVLPITDLDSTSNHLSTSQYPSFSNSLAQTTSIDDKSMSRHHVTVQSPTGKILVNAVSSKNEHHEPVSLDRVQIKKMNHTILAPRPFRAASVHKETPPARTQSDKRKQKTIVAGRVEESMVQTIDSHKNIDTSSGEAEMSDEVEMKYDASVSKFDSGGNIHEVIPQAEGLPFAENKLKTDENSNIANNNDSPTVTAEPVRSGAVLQRMNALSLEEPPITETGAEKLAASDIEAVCESNNEDAPPPLLPRERTGRGSRSTVVPLAGNKIQGSMTSESMYASRKPRQAELSRNVSSDPSLPPPLLSREQLKLTEPTEDYTPMTGNSFDIPICNKESSSSSGSLNSFLDRAAYEPMGQQGLSSEPKEPEVDEEIFASYSRAVDPPKRKGSIPEYYEIDPDPDVPITATGKLATPPPSLADEVTSQKVSKVSDSPPPLPPLNPEKKRLNYIEVEVGSNVGVYGGVRGKSQKINYTEVLVGAALPKDDSNLKKGKTVKDMLISMFSSKSHEEYVSEGDASSKDDDERTTDFSKERNKLKRLSGRLLRKKKHKSKDESRHPTEIESSSQSQGGGDHRNTTVAIHGSATNLSATSSESSRSLTQVVAGNGRKAGDGHSKPHHTIQAAHLRNNDRRRSHEPPPSQMPPKLHEKSLSEVLLNVQANSSKLHHSTQKSPQLGTKSAGNTPSLGRHAKKSEKHVGGSSVITTSLSHLHQQQHAPRPRSPRPISAPLGQTDITLGASHLRPASTSNDIDPMRKSPRLDMSRVLPLPVIKDTDAESQVSPEQLSPNFPSEAPPPPPSHPPPPAPMRELKPDRFKKSMRPGSPNANFSTAGKISTSDSNDVVTITPRLTPLSSSAKSKLVESEPLYQVYRSRTMSHASMRARQNPEHTKRPNSTPAGSRMSKSEEKWRSDLMTDDVGSTTLWREVREVVESEVGRDLTNDQMKLQQAQFEVVTSQASYLRSLNILIDHFMKSAALENPDVVPKQRRKELFSNIVMVREVERRFLQEIEQHFWDKLYLTEIAEITARHAKSDFEVYVRYVQNQVYQDRVLSDLSKTNDRFSYELRRLESSPACNKLPLLSFLLLPMQRVTRLPLLISAIVNQADSAGDKKAYDSAKQALGTVSKLVKKCNESARKMQQTEQLAEIAKQITFASKVKTYALVSQSRSIVKKGEMAVTMAMENRKAKSMKLWLFLFSDVLLLARKKTFLESRFEVIDWAKRAMLYVNERAVSENEIFLVLLENCHGKRVELTLTSLSLNELSRWTDALNPQHTESEDSIYETWDCPQYQCIVPYTALQPDELMLDVGDVMRVLKKTSDGWLEGERLRDNEMGWFPSENCEEIEDEHVRARNLRNLYRIVPAAGITHE